MNGQALSSITRAPAGAGWQRVDLHLHSPGIPRFGGENGSDTRSEAGRLRLAERYADRLRAAGIQIGAITDYNRIDPGWFPLLRDAAAEQDIALLPGVEVAFNAGGKGLHVLAVFDAGTDPAAVNRVLQSLDRDPATPLTEEGGQHRHLDPDRHHTDCLRQLRQRFGCLLIPAHPEQRNGFVKSFSAADAARFLTEIDADAIEHCSQRALERLCSTGTLDTAMIERLALVEFSDAKAIGDIGTRRSDIIDAPRATYLKLSASGTDALRLALHDKETRVRVGAEPPPPTHARIIGVTVQGSGFLGGLSTGWNDQLNSLIGGRGTGKSAIIEVLRYALDLEAYDDAGGGRYGLVRHALGSGGRVTVLVGRPVSEATSPRYEISRVLGEPAQVRDLDARTLDVRPRDVFGPGAEPLVFGQREIQAVAGDEDDRLQLLDDLIGEDARQAGQRVREIAGELRANQAAILEVACRLTERDAHEQHLQQVEHEIAVYEREGIAEKLRVQTDLSADGETLGRATRALRTRADAWTGAGGDAVDELAALGKALLSGRSEQAVLLARAGQVLEELREHLDSLVAQGATALSAAGAQLGALQEDWRDLLRAREEELARVRQELNSDILDPDRLLRLARDRQDLQPRVAEFQRQEAHLTALREQRRALLARYREARHAEFQLRQRHCQGVQERLGGRLRLGVAFKAQKDTYRTGLGEVFRRSGVTAAALDLLAAPEPTDGAALAEAARRGPRALQDAFGLTAAMAQKVAGWLGDDEQRLLELELHAPADRVLIELVVDAQPRDLSRLSLGQRATAVLLLLFALDGRPLLLDQPEDDLDNRFVYEDVVTLLRRAKGTRDPHRRRQIIVATHNANIPVLGDAELVLSLEARSDRAEVVGSASIDDVGTRERLRTVLEGGEEAFRRRSEKYGT